MVQQFSEENEDVHTIMQQIEETRKHIPILERKSLNMKDVTEEREDDVEIEFCNTK